MNSTSENFENDLKKLLQELRINCALECIGGTTTGQIVNNLPRGSTCYLYGNLSESNISGIETLRMIGNSIKLEGWFASNAMKKRNMLKNYYITKEAAKYVEETKISKSVGLHEF